MSGSKFLRLYREMDRSLPSKPTPDHLYEKERQETLQKLPEFRKVFKLKKPIERPKHHGKIIRILSEGGINERRRREREKTEKERKDRLHVHQVMTKSTEINEIIEGLHHVAQNRLKIPILLAKKMDLIDERDGRAGGAGGAGGGGWARIQPLTASSASSSATSSPSRLQRAAANVLDGRSIEDVMEQEQADRAEERQSQQRETRNYNDIEFDNLSIRTTHLPRLDTKTSMLAPPHVSYRHVRLYDRTTSESRWSNAEREKLHDLYQRMNLPPKKCHLEIWRAYFRELCQRFKCFFPERSSEEIIEKARLMIAKSQMKEKYEEEFWDFLKQIKSVERENKIPVVGKNIYSK